MKDIYFVFILGVCILLRVWDQGWGVSICAAIFIVLCYYSLFMFQSYNLLQVDIYTMEINTTDNGSIVFFGDIS
jgi:hypothetical protein